MKMKMKKSAKKRVSLTQNWRWQFLRLNEEYRKDYKRYSKLMKKLEERPHLQSVREAEFQRDFREKYGINYPCEPQLDNPPEDLYIFNDKEVAVIRGGFKSLPAGFVSEKDRIYGAYLLEIYAEETRQYFNNAGEPLAVVSGMGIPMSQEELDNIKKNSDKIIKGSALAIREKALQVVINYRAPLAEIKRELRVIFNEIRNFQHKYEVKGNQGNRGIQEKIRNYEEYLRIYSFRYLGIKNKGKPGSEYYLNIAKKVWPGRILSQRIIDTLTGKELEAAEKNSTNLPEDVRQALTKAIPALIAGGYRNISFPE